MSEIPAAARRKIRERDGGCWICGVELYDVHHRQRRRDGGHALSNLIALCRLHHGQAHANPRSARDWGLIVRFADDPLTVPVWSPQLGVWRLLDDLGGVADVA